MIIFYRNEVEPVIGKLVLALGEETAVQAVIGSISWAFRRLKKAKEPDDERLRICAS